jgi:hypothetical protein
MKRTILGILFMLAFAPALAASEAWVLDIPLRGNTQQETGEVRIWLGLNAAPQGAQLVVNGTTTLNLGDTQMVGGDSVSFLIGTGNQVKVIYKPLSNFGADFCSALPNAQEKMIPMRFSGAQDVTDYHIASYIVAAPNVECSQVSKHTGDTPATINPQADNVAPALVATFKGRNTFDVGLVLDKSGSMADLPPGANAGANKEAILVSAVQAFVGNWEQIDQPSGTEEWSGDRLELVYFDSTAAAQTLQGADPPANVFLQRGMGSAWDTVINTVAGLTPGANTSIGGGINEAMKQWKADPKNDLSLILVTDGMQNTAPLIQPTASGFLGLAPVSGLPQELRQRFIPIQTIGFGTPAAIDEQLLKSISLETNGQSYLDVNATTLFNSFASTLVAILKGNSASIATRQEATINANLPVAGPAVVVDRSAARAVFSLQWAPPLTNALQLEVFRPGAAQAAVPFSHKNLPQAAIQTFNLTPAKAGTWTYRVVRTPGSKPGPVPYAVNVFFLERDLDFELFFPIIRAVTGEPIRIRALVDWNHRPLTGLPPGSIKARVLRTVEPLGTLLRNSRATLSTAPSGEARTPFEQKIAAARVDPQKEVGSVVFREVGKGYYEAVFDDTSVPGSYAFEIVLDWTSERSGNVHREERIEQFVRVKPDTRLTDITTTAVGNGVFNIAVTPRDRFGNYLGPGYASSIRLAVRNGKLRSEVPADPQEIGTYTFVVGDVPADQKPEFTVSYE